MKLNAKGLSLIKRFEGFRSRAYRDPVGIWTIGYGHTSRAGLPIVSRGMIITKKQGQEILMRDVNKFARQIRPLIKVPLNDNQFSALVSFAYNVGVGGFKRSSVLKRINAKRFDAVPHRLALWVKAGGRPLRGLVRRRAAEGELFLTPSKFIPKPAHTKTTAGVEPVKGKSFEKSTTNFAAILSAIAGLFSSISTGLNGNLNGLVVIILMIAIVLATGWIVRERWVKSQIEGV